MPAHLLAALPERALASLYDASGARRWALPFEAFGEALERSARHRFGEIEPAPPQLRSYLDGLHLADLALASACANGQEPAWEHFVSCFQAPLRRAAHAITRTGGADDLADALFAELFGLVERDGARRSLFIYFHGRSTLGTWLRAVLAQRHVDALRARRGDVPLDADAEAFPHVAEGGLRVTAPPDPDQARLAAWMTEAVREEVERLEPRDRLRLSLYYRESSTLAAIGRILDEHESTVSRQLDRSRRRIREGVERTLAERHRLGPSEVHEAFEAALADPRLALEALLGAGRPAAPASPPAGPAAPRKNAALDRSMEEEPGTTP